MTQNNLLRPFVVSGLLAGLSFCLLIAMLSPPALAVPYASGISESGGTVTYVLNEDADSITVVRDGDTNLILSGTDLDKGTHTFPKGSATAYDIEVTKNTSVNWTQTNDPTTEVTSQYWSPRGVAVNKNPSSVYFGSIYVSNALQGTTDPNGLSRLTSNGLYAITADGADAYGIGDIARDGGLFFEFSDGNTNTPFRVTVAPDDTVYIGGWSDEAPGVWRAPGDLSGVSWPNVLANDNCDIDTGLCDNHGNVASMWVEGTGASTVLYTMDEDYFLGLDNRKDIFRYNIGTSTDYTGLPTIQVDNSDVLPDANIINGRMDVVRDEDGTWWIAQYRFDDSEFVPALSHWADDPNGGEALWFSGRSSLLAGDADFNQDLIVAGDDFLTWQRNFSGDPNNPAVGSNPAGDANFDGFIDQLDLLIWETQYGTVLECCTLDLGRGNLDIDNVADRIIVGGGVNSGNTKGVYVLDISDPNNPTIEAIIPQFGESNDVSFDAAGNVYVVGRTSETLRIWSPGGNFVATTGSDGTFSLAPSGALAAVPEPSAILSWLAFSLLTLFGYRPCRQPVQNCPG